MKQETLNKLNICENHERECKLANGGLPESIWETYSSFANTNGGTILLGIREHRDSFTIEGLTDKQTIKYQKDFWSTLNDRNKISKNILLNHHVQVVEVEDKKILKIDIPAAAKNKKGALSPTIAGLLFFGEAYHITEVFPNYFLDYREECDDRAVRWLFRTE